MKHIPTLFIFLFFIFCSKKESDKEKEIVQIPYIEQHAADTLKERNYITVFDDVSEKNTKLTKEELEIVDRNLIIGVEKYNNDLKTKLNELNNDDKTITWNYEDEKIDLRYYYRQYFVVNEKNGDKIVKVFCFCNYSDDGWRKYRMSVFDGGDCYLRAEINITQNKISYFRTHGMA